MEATVSAVKGTTDHRLTDLNEKHRNFYGKQKQTIEKLSLHKEVLIAAVRRINLTTSLLRAPTTPEAAVERLRNASTFEQEILEFDTVLKTEKQTSTAGSTASIKCH